MALVEVEVGDKPHDAFFKVLLAQPGVAGALLRERLPPEAARRLRVETARPLNASFIDNNLRESSADLLLEVDSVAGARELVYVLVEHKSRPSRWISWQLLKYQVRLYEAWRRANPEQPLPAITTMVVYHGEEPWNVPKSFGELRASGEEQRPDLLDFRYQLVNLWDIRDEELSENPQLRAGLLVLKHARRVEERAKVVEVAILAFRGAREVLGVLFSYILTAHVRDYAELEKVVRRIIPEEEPMFRSAADQLREEGVRIGRDEGVRIGRDEGVRIGRDEGLREGALHAKATTLRRQLAQRFGSVPVAAEERIRAAEEAQLDAWLDRILTAKSVEEVLADS